MAAKLGCCVQCVFILHISDALFHRCVRARKESCWIRLCPREDRNKSLASPKTTALMPSGVGQGGSLYVPESLGPRSALWPSLPEHLKVGTTSSSTEHTACHSENSLNMFAE